jgi:hypothetical protein
MAYIVAGNGDGYFVTISVMDRNEDKAVLTYELRAADEAGAIAAVATILTEIGKVSQVVILGYNIQKRYFNDAIIIPAAGELQIKARIAFRIANSPEYETLDIPAPDEDIFLALNGKNNSIVDTADLAVISYTNMFKAVGICFISDGESLEQVSEGKKVSSRKGMRS